MGLPLHLFMRSLLETSFDDTWKVSIVDDNPRSTNCINSTSLSCMNMKPPSPTINDRRGSPGSPHGLLSRKRLNQEAKVKSSSKGIEKSSNCTSANNTEQCRQPKRDILDISDHSKKESRWESTLVTKTKGSNRNVKSLSPVSEKGYDFTLKDSIRLVHGRHNHVSSINDRGAMDGGSIVYDKRTTSRRIKRSSSSGKKERRPTSDETLYQVQRALELCRLATSAESPY